MDTSFGSNFCYEEENKISLSSQETSFNSGNSGQLEHTDGNSSKDRNTVQSASNQSKLRGNPGLQTDVLMGGNSLGKLVRNVSKKLPMNRGELRAYVICNKKGIKKK